MIIKNLQIVTLNKVIKRGYLLIKEDKIVAVGEGDCFLDDEIIIDADGKTAMPGFIDIHIHGSVAVDFMDASKEDITKISESLYEEGVTTYLATTLTSDKESLAKVCEVVNAAKGDNPSLLGLHFEGPYICKKYKGAQNEAYIRNPDIEEFDYLNNLSGNNIKYISLAPETEGAMEFIKHVTAQGVTVAAGHTDATFDQVEEAIKNGLTNTTHTHNAMSGHHHRNPGVVSAAIYFDELFTEVICDGIHVCPNTIKTFFKAVGSNRFVMITDALKVKHSDVETFRLFGLDCVRKDGAAYLTSGPLAGSLLSMDQGLRNLKDYIKDITLIDLMKVSSYNAARSLHLNDRGLIAPDMLADIVLLDETLHVTDVYKLGKKVF
jgi:N-acetylglucosamine-6-phosphate deacetylase